MLNDFDTADLISARRDDVTPEDERTVSDLMVDQIEFADIIILNKVDMVRNPFVSRCCAYVLTRSGLQRNQEGHHRPCKEAEPPRQDY